MLKRLALVVASIVAAFALGEIGLRMMPIQWFYSAGYIQDINAEFHHSYRPGDVFVRRPQPPDDFVPVVNRINSLAMRGPEPRDVPVRALLIGDSYIQADEVEYDNSLGPVLEKALRVDDSNAVVLSHGMASWSPLLEWNWYLKIGRQFGAHDVILFVFYNDFDPQYVLSDGHYLGQAVFARDGRPQRFTVGTTSPVRRVLRTLRLAALWRLWRLRFYGQPPPTAQAMQVLDTQEITSWLSEPADVFEQRLAELRLDVALEGYWRLQRPFRLWSEEFRKRVEVSRPIIASFAADVARDHGRLRLVYIPMGMQVGGRECQASRSLYGVAPDAVIEPRSGVQEWLEGVAVELGIDWLDLTEPLRDESAGAEAPLYLQWDCHWSRTGHERIARTLAEWLELNKSK